MTPQGKQAIVGVDVIRFAAATMVMASHLCAASWADRRAITFQITGGQAVFPELFAGTWFGWVGVEIFFVISGLVIAYSAEGITALAFLRGRLLRLYPAAWVCATLTAITTVALGIGPYRQIFRGWLAAVTLFPFPPYIDPVYWTLGIEIAFYGLIFLLLAFRAFHRLEYMVMILGALSSAYWVFGAAFVPDFLAAHFGSRRLELSLIGPGCCFAVGALTYVIAREGLTIFRLLATATCITAVLIEVSFRSTSMYPGQSALPPQIAFFVATVLIFGSMRGIVSGKHWLARLVRVVGLATYPLYLFHQIVGAALMKVALAYGGSRYTALAFAVTLCIFGSLLIANFVEPRIRSPMRRFFDRWAFGGNVSHATANAPVEHYRPVHSLLGPGYTFPSPVRTDKLILWPLPPRPATARQVPRQIRRRIRRQIRLARN